MAASVRSTIQVQPAAPPATALRRCAFVVAQGADGSWAVRNIACGAKRAFATSREAIHYALFEATTAGKPAVALVSPPVAND